MEMLFSLGIVLGLCYVVLVLLNWLKEVILSFNKPKVHAGVAAHKEKTIEEISAWAKREKKLIEKQLEDEYSQKTKNLQDKLNNEAEEIRKQIKSNISGLNIREDELQGIIADLEEEIKEIRNTRTAELEAEMTEKRSAEIAEIEKWSSEETKRLSTRFAKDYEVEVTKLKQEFNTRMDTELDNIKKLFTDFSIEEKTQAKEDIKSFIMRKLSQVT